METALEMCSSIIAAADHRLTVIGIVAYIGSWIIASKDIEEVRKCGTRVKKEPGAQDQFSLTDVQSIKYMVLLRKCLYCVLS